MRVNGLTAILAIFFMVAAAGGADAACQKLGFTVNDYGKDGPTRDAKNLLDKYIKNWTKVNGIEKYTVGKKTVSCYLFLDFGFFDEHTCKAVATFCWKGPAVKDPKDADAS